MSRLDFSRRAAGITYVVVHKLVRLLSVVIILLVCAFVFLRLYGVPDPLLQLLLQRANAAGIPIQVESLALTIKGWRAEGVSYYSRHPDDLSPLFEADEVLFVRKREVDTETSKGWKIDFAASKVRITPSVEWGVNIPEESPWRQVDEISLTAAMLPDRVEFSAAEMLWQGIRFNFAGELIKPSAAGLRRRGSPPGKVRQGAQETVLPVYVSTEMFEQLEIRLKQLALEGDAQVDVEFSVDMRDYADSSVAVSLHAEKVMLRQVDFDEVHLDFSYAYPHLKIGRLEVRRNGQTLGGQADYDLENRLFSGRFDNSVTSRKLLLLAPQPVLDLLAKAQLQFDELPEFSVQAGPAPVGELLEHISASFSLRDVTYCGLVVEAARGKAMRSGSFLEISDIQARVQGQELRAGEFGSCMAGGSMEGRVFWDADRAVFGVEAEGSADPNLFIAPLAAVPIATNIIDRFYFPTERPQISLQLGACYTNWSTFYIDISGMGHDVGFHEALLSTANVSAFYTNSVLKLDPIAAMDGADFLKGDAAIDFREDTAAFDVFGTMRPELVEDGVWPFFNIFGNHIKSSGKTEIKAAGKIDWAAMQATDFRAEVETERLEVPVAVMKKFKGTVIGSGPVISVTNAVCRLYGGDASGSFEIELNPATTNLPYGMDIQMSGVDVKKLQEHMHQPTRDRTKGKLTGNLKIRSDLTGPFLVNTKGNGSVYVEEGELADLPVFSGFSNLMRRIMPGFNFFSITSLNCDFRIRKGAVYTENAAFVGDLFNASADGKYSYAQGYDADVRVNVFSDKGLSKVIRVIISPISKLFELHLSGTLDKPEWRLKNFTPSVRSSGNDSN